MSIYGNNHSLTPFIGEILGLAQGQIKDITVPMSREGFNAGLQLEISLHWRHAREAEQGPGMTAVVGNAFRGGLKAAAFLGYISYEEDGFDELTRKELEQVADFNPILTPFEPHSNPMFTPL